VLISLLLNRVTNVGLIQTELLALWSSSVLRELLRSSHELEMDTKFGRSPKQNVPPIIQLLMLHLKATSGYVALRLQHSLPKWQELHRKPPFWVRLREKQYHPATTVDEKNKIK